MPHFFVILSAALPTAANQGGQIKGTMAIMDYELRDEKKIARKLNEYLGKGYVAFGKNLYVSRNFVYEYFIVTV